ncbi:acetyltransferase, GNAT family [Fusobacterium animalis 11_3_2]|uniref:Acetyltransferase, GNAT family n=2 Tax=Fusobacterium TaxID=848 RepID=F7L050_9FUSO|nr:MULTISPECIES: GNAT family N-acetyltransferase [Fusobacterium]EGN67059.1 acetyltransferase, GNAT family [Fusobacterium animalis 11_3_2]
MNIEVIRLKKDNQNKLIELFLDCFSEDVYYQKLFPNKNTIRNDMKISFQEVIEFCLNNNNVLGIFEEKENLIGFLIFFDYLEVKSKFPKIFNKIFGANKIEKFPYFNEIHKKLLESYENIIYLLSLGVKKEYRRKKIASTLIDFLIKNYEGYSIASDISNETSLEIYKKRNFIIEKISENYYYVKTKSVIKNELVIDYNKEFYIAMPDNKQIKEILKNYDKEFEETKIDGYAVVFDGYLYSFKKLIANKISAYIYKINYEELLEIQRYINITLYIENRLSDNKGRIFLLYSLINPHKNKILYNEELDNLIRKHKNEWNTISDVQIFFPIEYENQKKILEKEQTGDVNINLLLKALDFRTYYESGIPKWTESNKSILDYRRRLHRIFLGKYRIKITKETSLMTYEFNLEDIGQPAFIYLITTIDLESNTGVVTLVSMSTPFLLSHLLDNTIRNQILICVDDFDKSNKKEKYINLYDFLESYLGIYKRGSPKTFINLPYEKDKMECCELASLLMSETIYSNDEELGRFIDQDIMKIVESENGMGQYDRGFVAAATNVLLYFAPILRTSIEERILEEAITAFYIELLTLEEAATEIANNSIIKLLTNVSYVEINDFLQETHLIFNKYVKTMVFWDVKMNYPSSKKSMTMLRTAFEIEENIKNFEKNQKELRNLFETKRDIIDRMESTMLNYIILFLTLIQGISIILPMIFGGTNFPINQIYGVGIVTFSFIVYIFARKYRLRKIFKNRKI